MTQDEYVRKIWYTQSRWGIRRRNRIAIACLSGAAVVVCVVLALLLK